MKSVAVLGWYGHHNVGDDLIFEGFRQLFRGWKIVPMSNSSTETVPCVDFDMINRCDLFVLGGGELICSNRVFIHTPAFCGFKVPILVHRVLNRMKIFNNVSWVHNVRVPKVILGCGVNVDHISDLDKNVISELRQFDYIGLRDQESVNILRSHNALKDKTYLFYDLVFSLKLPGVSDGVIEDENTAVVIPTDRQNRLASESVSWLKKKLLPFDKTVFLSFGQEDNNDYETCQKLGGCAKKAEIVPYEQLSLQSIIDYIACCGMVFPYRLHGLILSFILNKKYSYYPYHRKLSRVHETIQNLSAKTIGIRQQQEVKKLLNA